MAEKIEVLYYVDSSADAVSRRDAPYSVDGIAAAVAARGKARIAISGGNTPKGTFELLATSPYREQTPWDKLELYWVDERCVPPDDADSNYRMTRQALLDKVPLTGSQVFRIQGELDPEEGAARYELAIRALPSGWRGRRCRSSSWFRWEWGMTGIRRRRFRTPKRCTCWCRIAVANRVTPQKDSGD